MCSRRQYHKLVKLGKSNLGAPLVSFKLDFHPRAVFVFTMRSRQGTSALLLQRLCIIRDRIGCTFWPQLLFFCHLEWLWDCCDWNLSISKPYDGRFNQRGNPFYISSKQFQVWNVVDIWYRLERRGTAFNSCDWRGGNTIPVLVITSFNWSQVSSWLGRFWVRRMCPSLLCSQTSTGAEPSIGFDFFFSPWFPLRETSCYRCSCLHDWWMS